MISILSPLVTTTFVSIKARSSYAAPYAEGRVDYDSAHHA
jgi:hypothetical protein